MKSEEQPDRRKTDWGKLLLQGFVVSIIAAIISISMSWSLYEFKINQAHAAVAEIKVKDSEQDSRIVKVETRLDFSEKYLDNIDTKFNEILRYLRK